MSLFIKCCHFLCLIFISKSVFAADPLSFIDVTLSQTNYSGAPQIAVQQNQYSEITPSFVYFRRFGSPENVNQVLYSEGLIILPMNDGVELNAALPEIYGELNNWPLTITLGRKKQNWSELDSHWNLGLWQPLVRWDAAEPIEQGLTGLFYEYKGRRFKALAMASGVFLPDQQPDYKEDNGQVVSANRWFRAPITKLGINFGNSDVYYNVEEPPLADVINNSSFAGQFKFGKESYGSFLNLAVADKPMNQFHLGIDPTKGLALSGPLRVTIFPMVVRHKLFTIEAGYKWLNSKLILSSNIEKIDNPELPEAWEETELMDSRYTGVVLSQRLDDWGVKKTILSFSYVLREKENRFGESTTIEGDVDSSTSRFAFDKLVGAELSTNFVRKYKRELDGAFKYVYSIEDQAEWFQTSLRLRENRNWLYSLSLDVFGAPSDALPSTSFISMFRGNDRVTGSVTYVF